MEIKKAVITAAGKNQRTLPLQTLVDRDGNSKTALTIIIEEILKTGVDEISIVISPGDEAAYRAACGSHLGRVAFVEQPQPLGYGHAISCACDFTKRDPFLLLVGDHLYLSKTKEGCAEQLVKVAKREECCVSGVQATHESKLPYYGTVGGRLVPGHQSLYKVDTVVEKPTPTEAEQKLIVPGLRSGNYLCYFGMHVFTATVMDLLVEMVAQAGGRGGVQLTSALAKLSEKQRYLAYEVQGRRYDIGVKYGLLTAQLALALDGNDRDEVLSGMVELLATRSKS